LAAALSKIWYVRLTPIGSVVVGVAMEGAMSSQGWVLEMEMVMGWGETLVTV
jgi:hypothetical protein